MVSAKLLRASIGRIAGVAFTIEKLATLESLASHSVAQRRILTNADLRR